MPFQKGHKINIGNKWNIGRKNHLGFRNSEEVKNKLSIIHKKNWKEGKEKLNDGNFKLGQTAWNKGLIGFRAGEKSHLWKGGISFSKYGKEFNNRLKELIKERDNYTCQLCGEKNKKLHIHHIDYNKQNNSLRNLITLCHNCHSKTNYKRETWMPHLQSIMEVAN